MWDRDMSLSTSTAFSHLALQHSAAGRAAQVLQSFCCGTVEGFRQQEAETACRQTAQTEDGEGHGGVESPLQHTHTHTRTGQCSQLGTTSLHYLRGDLCFWSFWKNNNRIEKLILGSFTTILLQMCSLIFFKNTQTTASEKQSLSAVFSGERVKNIFCADRNINLLNCHEKGTKIKVNKKQSDYLFIEIIRVD